MIPPSESTKLEAAGAFVEYVGSGKLKDKKVLITGGELVVSFLNSYLTFHYIMSSLFYC